MKACIVYLEWASDLLVLYSNKKNHDLHVLQMAKIHKPYIPNVNYFNAGWLCTVLMQVCVVLCFFGSIYGNGISIQDT